MSAAVYWNNTDDAIRFTPVAAYSAANPPPGWPLPPQFVPPGALPSRYTYVNLGTVKDKGIELGVDAAVNSAVTLVRQLLASVEAGGGVPRALLRG